MQSRFGEILRRQPKEESGWYGVGYNVLSGLQRFGGEAARPLFRDYLRDASVQRYATVCEVLRRTDGKWDLEFLVPMLADLRPDAGYRSGGRPIRAIGAAIGARAGMRYKTH